MTDLETRFVGSMIGSALGDAIFSFLRHPDSFERCLFCAILNGGDRDTLGAMACALSGAYLGQRPFPLHGGTASKTGR